MRTKYHKRRNPVLHGDEITHTPNGTAILMDMITRGIKYNIIKYRRKHNG